MKRLTPLKIGAAILLALLAYWLVGVVLGLVSAALTLVYYAALATLAGGIGWYVWSEVISPAPRRPLTPPAPEDEAVPEAPPAPPDR